MPARKVYHQVVVEGILNDGWEVATDPLRLVFGERDMYVDLGPIGSTLIATRAGREIAVENQSFLGRSAVDDLHRAVGQYLIYQAVLDEIKPRLPIYMQIRATAFEESFTDELGQLIPGRVN